MNTTARVAREAMNIEQIFEKYTPGSIPFARALKREFPEMEFLLTELVRASVGVVKSHQLFETLKWSKW